MLESEGMDKIRKQIKRIRKGKMEKEKNRVKDAEVKGQGGKGGGNGVPWPHAGLL